MKMEHCNWPQFTTGVIIGVKIPQLRQFLFITSGPARFHGSQKKVSLWRNVFQNKLMQMSVSAFAIFQKKYLSWLCLDKVKGEREMVVILVGPSFVSLSLSHAHTLSHTHSLSNTHTRAHTLSLNFEPWSVAFVGKVHIRNRCSQPPAPDVDGYSLRQISLQDYFFYSVFVTKL